MLLLNSSRLSDAHVAQIYRQRWGIEVFYRSFKQTYRKRKLLAHKADHVRVELDWALLALWSACLHARTWQDLSCRRLSVARVLRSFRHSMREYRSHPEPGEDLMTQLSLALIDTYRRRSKSSRDYPRKKREFPPGKPQIINATPQQIKKAQQLKHSKSKKG